MSAIVSPVDARFTLLAMYPWVTVQIATSAFIATLIDEINQAGKVKHELALIASKTTRRACHWVGFRRGGRGFPGSLAGGKGRQDRLQDTRQFL